MVTVKIVIREMNPNWTNKTIIDLVWVTRGIKTDWAVP